MIAFPDVSPEIISFQLQVLNLLSAGTQCHILAGFFVALL